MPDPEVCPTCEGALEVRVLECTACGTRVERPRPGNEFSDLDAETLHVLRIFVLCEGRIRDMEAALGVSYPTVKSKLSKLRETLGLAGREAGAQGRDTSPPSGDATAESDSAGEILARLEAGDIPYTEALARIRALRS